MPEPRRFDPTLAMDALLKSLGGHREDETYAEMLKRYWDGPGPKPTEEQLRGVYLREMSDEDVLEILRRCGWETEEADWDALTAEEMEAFQAVQERLQRLPGMSHAETSDLVAYRALLGKAHHAPPGYTSDMYAESVQAAPLVVHLSGDSISK